MKKVSLLVTMAFLLLAYQNCTNFESFKSESFSSILNDSSPTSLPNESSPLPTIESNTPNSASPPATIANGESDIGSATDPALTKVTEDLASAYNYEKIFFDQFSTFLDHTLDHFENPDFTDQKAKDAGYDSYSSGAGWATYHTLDEILALTKIIYLTKDKNHLDKYVAGAFKILRRVIPCLLYTSDAADE